MPRVPPNPLHRSAVMATRSQEPPLTSVRSQKGLTTGGSMSSGAGPNNNNRVSSMGGGLPFRGLGGNLSSSRGSIQLGGLPSRASVQFGGLSSRCSLQLSSRGSSLSASPTHTASPRRRSSILRSLDSLFGNQGAPDPTPSSPPKFSFLGQIYRHDLDILKTRQRIHQTNSES